MRRWLAIGMAVVGVAAAGCAKADSGDAVTNVVPLPKGLARCEDVYKADATINPNTFGDACSQGDEMMVPRPMILHCSNKKVFYWNEFAWGYEKEPMTLIGPDDDNSSDTPAFRESVKCIKKATTATTSG